MKLRKTRQQRKGRVEIIPMIDVMFFLLATFMLASLSLQKLDAIKLNLPQGAAAPMAQQAAPVTLSITADNHVLINHQPTSLAKLAQTLKPLLHTDQTVIVSADEHAQQGTVVHAMLAAQSAGVVHFLIAVAHE